MTGKEPYYMHALILRYVANPATEYVPHIRESFSRT